MRYYVEVGDKTCEVEIDGAKIRVDGRAIRVDLERNSRSDLFHLLLDGRSHTLRLRRAEGRGTWEAEIGGRPYRVTALDERRRAIRKIAGSTVTAGGPLDVRAPMPGLVVAVQVAEGDEVAKGDPLLVIEAMKMENELKAEATGRITRVHAAPGQAVERGESLLVIEVAEGARTPERHV